MGKIKRNILVICYSLLIAGLLLYTRFVGLDWGLPYPMHPDERNMAVAVQRLNCEVLNSGFEIANFKQCFNPHFFAYGQFPLYLAYFLIWLYKVLSGFGNILISYELATMTLRLISAISSVSAAIMLIKIIKIITGKEKEKIWWWLLIIFSPFFIQFSHFGTTESLLIFFYLLIIYFSLLLLEKKITGEKFVFLSGFFSGLSLATKVSSIIYLALPIFVILSLKKKNFYQKIFFIAYFLGFAFIFNLIFSPHNFISWDDFYFTFKYERAVALGEIPTFYTMQFQNSLPIIFQLIKVVPSAMGLITAFLGFMGFIRIMTERKKNKKLIFLALAFLLYFLPNGLIFAKWTRFLAPVFPVILIFAILFLEKIKILRLIKFIIVVIAILPGIAYLSIYQNPDVRFSASEWILKNIPENSYILSETANVLDIPVISPKSKDKGQKLSEKKLQIISFNFYDLDQNYLLQQQLRFHLSQADYIFVPSRRIFANYSCFWPDKSIGFFDNFSYLPDFCQYRKEKFPILNNYYHNLFFGNREFVKVAEFSSYPKISFLGKTLIEFSDERAEETWTVFDHPVIRVYKRK